MKIAGVIAEYNPFHNGHAVQLASLKALGYDAVVCAVSPSVVQRGEPACLPTAVRVRAALAGGADLVLCLPAPYACKSAEGFALAGVTLLDALGCVDTLAFGAETPDTARLQAVAGALESAQFRAGLRRFLDEGMPLAAARAAVAGALCPGAKELLESPNNILAVDYCRALQRLGSGIQPLALARRGAQHDGAVSADGYASASALRQLWRQQQAKALAAFVPAACLALYREAETQGLTLDERAWSAALLSRLRGGGSFAAVRGAGEGLADRLAAAARKACTAGELVELLKTKHYPTARLRRLTLDAALGYGEALPAAPPYLHVLGASGQGLAVLKAARPKLPMSASLADLARQNEACATVANAHAAAEDLTALARRTPQPCGAAYTQKFQITAPRKI